MKRKNAQYKKEVKKPGKVLKENSLDYSSKVPNAKAGLRYASFEISNFRCLKELHISDLGQVNLIAGVNNVGKTALLEALFLHLGSTNPELALRVDRWRGFEMVNEAGGTPWRALFWQFLEKEPIKLISKNSKGQERSLVITVQPSRSKLFEEMSAKAGPELIVSLGQDLVFDYADETKKPHKVIGTPFFRKKGDLIQFQLLMEPSPQSPPFPGIFLNSWRQGVSDEEVQRFTGLRIKREDHLFLKALKYIEPRLEKLEILSPKGVSMIHGYLRGYEEPIPLPLLGDGARRVASLVLSIGSARDGVVIVDEIENGIHHSLMKSLWEVIAEGVDLFDTQVFATTHSQECVVAAHEIFKSREQDKFRFHRLTRADGIVKAVTYDQESLEGALSIPLEVRG